MQPIDLSHLHTLKLPRVGQLGFVVQSLTASLPLYGALYNLNTWFEPLYLEKQFQTGGEIIEMDFQMVFAFSGGMQVELIQAPPGENINAQHLIQAGPGLHHLGFYLADLDRRMAAVHQMGLPVLLEGRFKTAGGSRARFAYLGTQDICGTVVELIEIKTAGISLPQTAFTMGIGRLTGDVRRRRQDLAR